jgi:SpoVK/Ycf46/Vps4 family AAA+-type ATPase
VPSSRKLVLGGIAALLLLAAPSFAGCEEMLLRGNLTLADLREIVAKGVQKAEIPSHAPFTAEQLEALQSGRYDRVKTLEDLLASETTFVDPRDPEFECKISSPGFYLVREKGSERWNPIPRETKNNIAARAFELKLQQSLARARVSLIDHLNPVQKKALYHFLTAKPWDQPLGLADIADAISVARALSLPEQTAIEGRTIEEWLAVVAQNNEVLSKSAEYAAFLNVIETQRADFLRSLDDKAGALSEEDPEREYADVASGVLNEQVETFARNLEGSLKTQFPFFAAESKLLCGELSCSEGYFEWLAQSRDHGYSGTQAVRETAKVDSGNLRLLELIAVIESAREQLLKSVVEKARSVWEANSDRAYADVLNEVLTTEAAQKDIELRESLKSFTGLGNAPKLLRREITHNAAHAAWAKDRRPDMAFGETILNPKPIQVIQISEIKLGLVKQLARLGEIGSEADLLVLEQMLASVDESILKELVNAKYQITVARNNVTNGAKDLRARTASSGITVDNAEGVHAIDPETGERRILIRSKMHDGKIVLNVGVLLHEIGHAVDLVLRAKGDEPLHVNQPFVDAFTYEHKFLPPYFHDQADFMAEVFARYALDRERTRRELPMSCKAFDSLGLAKTLVDGEDLVLLHNSMLAKAPVTSRPEAEEVVRKFETLNTIREKQAKAREPVILELDGEPAATMALAKQMGSYLVTLRAPTVSPFGIFDHVVPVSAADFNAPATLAKILDSLSGGYGALLYIDDLRSIAPTSPGFRVLGDFIERTRDLVYVVFAGSSEARKPFEILFHQALRRHIELDPLTTLQVVDLVQREVSNDGYEISEQAMAALTERASAGGYEAAMKLWGSIKREQASRTLGMEHDIRLQPSAVAYVLSRDVNSASYAKKRNPIEEIRKKVGLKKVKEKIDGIVAELTLARQAEELRIEHVAPPRLNLIFAGNPGTGKTSVALDLAESLFELGYVKRSTVAQVTVQDLLSGSPEAAVKKLFEDNKDGVIFIDEFHQLKDTPEGKRAFRAMIPYLTSATYARTVFIGAGYDDEVLELIRETDPGGERRFVIVPFEDYGREEMRSIADSMLTKNRLGASEEVKQALVERVMRKQRTMKHPGNAGDIESILGLSRETQRARLASLAVGRPLTQEDFGTLTLEDVVVPSALTVESVMAEIEALKGLETVKEQLRNLQALMAYNRARGDDVLSGVEPYILIEGPAGSGKSTLAAIVGRLFAANDVIPDPGIERAMGGDLVGGFIGNSTTLAVRKLFEKAWGKTLFIDEIGALAKAVGGYEEQAAKEMLAQMENNRGKLVFIVADYAHNIDAFLRLDVGLPRRFGLRLTLDAMSGHSASELLDEKLLDFKLDVSHLHQHVQERLNIIAILPGWGSGGDVRTLANKIRTQQAAAYMAASKKGHAIDPNKVDAETLDAALDELESEIRKRPSQGLSRAGGGFAHQHQHAHQQDHEEEKVTLSGEDRKYLAAITEVDTQFGDRFNTDPAELARQEENPQSDYNAALADKLGVTPERAKEIRMQVKVKVKKLVSVMEKQQLQHFKYHCPYCGGIDSPSCGFINHPIEWKIEHSMRKPWSEDVLVERQIEVEEDQIVDRKIP